MTKDSIVGEGRPDSIHSTTAVSVNLQESGHLDPIIQETEWQWPKMQPSQSYKTEIRLMDNNSISAEAPSWPRGHDCPAARIPRQAVEVGPKI